MQEDPSQSVPSVEDTLRQLTESASVLGPALRAYAKELPFGAAKGRLLDVAKTVESGTVVESLDNPRLRHRALLWSIVADHSSGGADESFLQSALDSVALYARRRNRLLRAFAYPAFLIFVCYAVTMAVLAYIAPQFREIFADFDMTLPRTTTLMLEGQHLMRALLLMTLAVITSGFLVPASVYDHLLQWIPVVGRYRQCTAVAQFCRSAASLVRSGLPSPVAAEHAGQQPGRPLLAKSAARLAQSLRARQVPKGPDYPLGSVVAFAFVIETTDQSRSKLLVQIADIYDQRANRLLRWLELTYEPFLAVFIGAGVGSIVIALLLPLVSLVQYLS